MPSFIAILAVLLALCVWRIKRAGDEVHALFRVLDIEPARVEIGFSKLAVGSHNSPA